jgi:G patch domain-containing protein 1
VSTFDVNESQFEIKEDMFGLGYKRLDVGSLFGKSTTSGIRSGLDSSESPAASLIFPMMPNQSKSSDKKSIKGQAFGVGDFEDDEDVDIYKQDSMELYDFELGGQKQTETRKALNKSYGFGGAFNNDAMIMQKFEKSKTRQEPVKQFPAPQIPPNFNLLHKFNNAASLNDENTNLQSTSNRKHDSMNSYLLTNVSERADLLGEEPIQPSSVFDLLNKEDRDFIKNKQDESNKKKSETELKEKKEKRYESFISFIKKNFAHPYSFVSDTKDLTEWEREKEKEEFMQRYQENLRKYQENMKKVTSGSKFVSTSLLNENNQEIETDKKEIQMPVTTKDVFFESKELTEMEKAAADKKYGKLTRVEFEWRPHSVLCKRFNVPNPYPK